VVVVVVVVVVVEGFCRNDKLSIRKTPAMRVC
jgi:hypothetical protein